ncbi:MAG: hypothetical protein HW405_184 [Candidatus Berkelbacteria bacterium]|nr:hypothetical protein [Candidatus Berkelbacteria bacterium]
MKKNPPIFLSRIIANKRERNAFSLIEVVFACAVLIIFMLAGVILYGTSMRNAVISKHRLTANYLANKYLEEFNVCRDAYYMNSPAASPNWVTILSSCAPVPASASYDGISYSYARANLAIFGGQRVTITVSWTDFSANYNVTLYRYLTDWQK